MHNKKHPRVPKCYHGLSVTAWLSEQFWGYSSIKPGKIYFYLKIGKFFENWGKKEDILDWEWGLISDPGDSKKRPGYLTFFK